jgi:O-antigen ligase
MVGWLLVFLGIILIYFTHKRGTWLALAAMLVVGMSVLARRRKYLIVAMLTVLALLFTIQARRLYARLDPNVPRYASILQRVELYNFALHIWATHPFMGTGLRPLTHAQYLKDYKQLDQNLTDFPQSVAKLQTLDNMVLTAFVELGSLMTLTYLGLVIFILARYVRTLWSSPESSTIDWYRLLVILGFAVHSMTYDSLLFPPVNWLFHVQLGVMAAYYTSNKAIDSTRNHHQIAA